MSLGKVQFDSMVIGLNDGTVYVQNCLEYACSEDGCEMAFLRDHLPWLLNAKYPTLMEKASLLLTRGTGGASKNFTQLLGEYCSYLLREYIGREIELRVICEINSNVDPSSVSRNESFLKWWEIK